MENIKFILTCLGIFAAIMLVAWLLQKKLCRAIKPLSSTHYITYTAMFATMAGVLMLIEIPLPFAPPFYKIDLSELPIMICTFYLGPVAGVTAELIKVLVKLLLKGTTTAFVGDFANFAVGCSFVLPASLVYHARPGKKSALVGLIVGTLCMTVFGSAFNAIYLLPKFAALYGMPMEAIVGMGTKVNAHITSVSTLVLFAVVPFNLLKGTSTAFVGDFANFAVGCSFVLPASLVYHARPGKKTALAGMAVGTAVMTAFGSAFNAVYLLPKFAALYGMPMEAIIGMGTKVNASIHSVWTLVLFAVVPFNLLKGVVVSALTFLLYKRISPLLHRGDALALKRRAQKGA